MSRSSRPGLAGLEGLLDGQHAVAGGQEVRDDVGRRLVRGVLAPAEYGRVVQPAWLADLAHGHLEGHAGRHAALLVDGLPVPHGIVNMGVKLCVKHGKY